MGCLRDRVGGESGTNLLFFFLLLVILFGLCEDEL